MPPGCSTMLMLPWTQSDYNQTTTKAHKSTSTNFNNWTFYLENDHSDISQQIVLYRFFPSSQAKCQLHAKEEEAYSKNSFWSFKQR